MDAHICDGCAPCKIHNLPCKVYHADNRCEDGPCTCAADKINAKTNEAEQKFYSDKVNLKTDEAEQKFYSAFVHCKNCDNRTSLKIKRGIMIYLVVCPECGCRSLERSMSQTL